MNLIMKHTHTHIDIYIYIYISTYVGLYLTIGRSVVKYECKILKEKVN